MNSLYYDMMGVLNRSKILKAKYAKRVNGKMQFVDKDEPAFTVDGIITYHITGLRELAFWACVLKGYKFTSEKEAQLKEDVYTVLGLSLDDATPKSQGDDLLADYEDWVENLMRLQTEKTE